MNKKGFIISTTLYSIFGIMIITIFTILFVLMNNRTIVSATGDKLKMCIKECDTPENICGDNDDKDKEPSAKDYILRLNDLQAKTVDLTKFAVSTTYKNSRA